RLPIGKLGPHGESDPASRGKLGGHAGVARSASAHEIIQDAVSDSLVKGPLISIGNQIKFQRLALDAELSRHVLDGNLREIHLAGYGTKRSEIGRLKSNPVISFCGIWECLEARLGW